MCTSCRLGWCGSALVRLVCRTSYASQVLTSPVFDSVFKKFELKAKSHCNTGFEVEEFGSPEGFETSGGLGDEYSLRVIGIFGTFKLWTIYCKVANVNILM